MDPDFWGTLHTAGGLRRLRLVHTTYSSRTVTGSGHAENQEIGYDQTPSSKRSTGRGDVTGSLSGAVAGPRRERTYNEHAKKKQNRYSNGSDSIESKRAAIEWLAKEKGKRKERT